MKKIILLLILPLISFAETKLTPIRKLTDQTTEDLQKIDPFYDYMNVTKRPGKEFGNEFLPNQNEVYKKIILKAEKEFNKIKNTAVDSIEKDTVYLFEEFIASSKKYFNKPEYEQVSRLLSVSHLWNRAKAYSDMGAGVASFPFEIYADFENYIDRSNGIPLWVDSYISETKLINKKGYLLSQQNMQHLLENFESLITEDLKKSKFYNPILMAEKTLKKEDIEKLEKKYALAIEKTIFPSIKKMTAFLKTNMKNTKPEFGLFGLKNGKKFYNDRLEDSTDQIGLNAEDLHSLGLSEVEKNKLLITDVKNKMGYSKKTFAEFIKFKSEDSNSYFTNKTDLEKSFRDAEKLVDSKVRNYFSTIPKTPLELRPIDHLKSPAGSYSGLTDTIDKAYFNYNSADLKATSKAETHTLYVHEGVPGHHFQLSINHDLKNQFGKFRGEMYGSTAFVEGWALYAEYLGREMGVYETNEHKLGNYSDDMLRAVRLVVDTGIHSMGWSREKAIQFMTDNIPENREGMVTEIDRYAVWPGQALGYKVGQLEIIKLRTQAEKELGSKFDIKEFHKTVLESGSINLKLLRIKVADWIKSTQSKLK